MPDNAFQTVNLCAVVAIAYGVLVATTCFLDACGQLCGKNHVIKVIPNGGVSYASAYGPAT